MTKDKKEVTAQEQVINEGNRPTLESNVVTSDETLAHNWQPGSPAVDLRYPGVADGAVNIVAEEAAAKERKEEAEKKKTISEAEMERRSKLDVSHPEYLNPSLNHVKAK